MAKQNRPPLTFDVISINKHEQHNTGSGWTLDWTPEGFTGRNVTLYQLVWAAYSDQDPKLIIGGPSWIQKDRFDLKADFDPEECPDSSLLTPQQRTSLLRTLLVDQFKLRVHFETKDFPVYNLVISQSGPKFAPTKSGQINEHSSGVQCFIEKNLHGSLYASDCTLTSLAEWLLVPSGRTVIDKTSLTGRYDFDLIYSDEYTPKTASNYGAPSIFAALQEELGLKLESTFAPLVVVIVDSAQHPA